VTRCRVRIIGGGIAGTAAALCLARGGAEVTLHERSHRQSEIGAGIQIGPNGMRVLDRLGLKPAIVKHANQPRSVLLRDGLSGDVVASVPLGAACLRRHGQPFVQAARRDLWSTLADAAEGAGAALRFGESADPQDCRDADLILGADGVRSSMRGLLVPDAAPAFTGQTAWRALVPAADAPDTLSPDAHVFMGPGRHLVAYPLESGRIWNIVAVAEQAEWTAEGWSQWDDPDRMRAAFAGWCPAVEGLISSVDRVLLWGLFAHGALSRWHDGRRALIGDACHPMLPFLAQGATMAIEDAWVLAECLSANDTVGAALARYEALRKPRTTRVQAASAANARIYHLSARGPRLALHSTLKAVSRVAPGLLLRKFDWLYGLDVTEDVFAGAERVG